MYAITDNKKLALDIQAHEEMISDNVSLYFNAEENKYAVKVSDKRYITTVDTLGEGWICLN